MSTRQAAACVAQAARWVPTLSLDEPINRAPDRWWRLLFAAGFLSTAAGEGLEETSLLPAPRPAPEATTGAAAAVELPIGELD